MMKKLVATLLALVALTGMNAQGVERPKLVVGLVVDQMRWDYLYHYRHLYGEGGLRRLVDEGFSCENTMINYLPTVTAIGHSSIYTGSVPALHGIAGNNFYEDGRNWSSCEDDNVRTVGSDTKRGQASPHNLLAATIGDELKIATDFKARVYGVAIKDRAAILPAGHAADGAFWWDKKAGNFITSTYYMDRLPQWAERFNKENHTAPDFDLNTSNLGVTMTFKMARAIIDNERLGHGEATDMIAISVSSTDAIGHTYGTRGDENREVFLTLDREMAQFFNYLDDKVGKGNYLLFLSADHGAAHNPNYLNKHKMPGGGWDLKSAKRGIDSLLTAKYGTRGLLRGIMDTRIYLNHHKMDSAGINITEAKTAVVDWLQRDKTLAFAVDCENLGGTTLPAFLRERIANGYHRHRSGDILIGTIPAHIYYNVTDKYIGTTHGVWNPDDSHIPLVFMGWHVKHGSTCAPTFIVDIAPTLSALLHIPRPNAAVGNPINEVINH